MGHCPVAPALDEAPPNFRQLNLTMQGQVLAGDPSYIGKERVGTQSLGRELLRLLQASMGRDLSVAEILPTFQ